MHPRRMSALDKRIQLSVPGLMESLRKQLAKRGSYGFSGLAKKFQLMDVDHSHTLSREEFQAGIQKVGITLTQRQIEVMFDYLDADHNGTINFDEFLAGIRGEMNQRRKAIVDSAFDELDSDGDGVLDFAELLAGYDALQDPRVADGSVSATQAKVDFLSAFEASGAGKKIKGSVTRAEWTAFFANISASVDSDSLFQMIVQNSWHRHVKQHTLPLAAEPLKFLVTHANGVETVEDIGDHFGFREGDVDFNKAVVVYLKKKGVTATHIEVLDSDGMRRNGGDGPEDSVNKRKPILGYKGHQHGRRDRMGTTFENWQAQTLEWERGQQMQPSRTDQMAGGSADWKSHSQHVHCGDNGQRRSSRSDTAFFNRGVRWVGEAERGESGMGARHWAHSSRAQIKPQAVNADRELTKEDLRRDYAIALSEVGGEPGVDALIQQMSGALTQRSKQLTALRMRVQKAFDNADVDQSGSIDRDEFRKAMELLNYVSSEAQVVAIFGSLDKHHTNHISVKKFVERLVQAAKKGFNAPQVSCTDGGKSLCGSRDVVGRSKKSVVEQDKLLRRVPGSAGEEYLRLASGERLSRVGGGKAWVTDDSGRASADCCMPDGTVVKVNLRHGEVVYEVLGGACYLTHKEATEASRRGEWGPHVERHDWESKQPGNESGRQIADWQRQREQHPFGAGAGAAKQLQADKWGESRECGILGQDHISQHPESHRRGSYEDSTQERRNVLDSSNRGEVGYIRRTGHSRQPAVRPSWMG